MSRYRGRFVWSLAYALLVASPLVVLASGLATPRGSGWWFDFSMGLGFAALGLFGGQFLLTARFRRATAPFGMDVLYLLHRWLAVAALGLVMVHYAVLRTRYPASLGPWLPLDAPIHMTAGRLSLVVFAVLVVSSLWRKALGIEYDRWRLAHAGLAVLGMALAWVHVLGVGYHSGGFWSRLVLDLFLGSLVAIVAYVRVVKPILLTGHPFRVTEVRRERGRCWTLRLAPDGHPGFRFAPGQFVWISLGRTPLRASEHPFSISGSAERAPELQLTVKELGDFTDRMGETQVGTLAYVDGPHGIFSVDRHPEAPGFLFVVGGVGIAPIVGMLRTLADRDDRRPLCVIYGTRCWEETPLREELARLSRALHLRTVHVLEEPHEGWDGAVGRPGPEQIMSGKQSLPEGFVTFLCGPTGLTEMAERTLVGSGVPLRRIHTELFDMA